MGTMHAYFALREGYKVIHIEKSSEPNAASTRNFGLIWVSGRAPGSELEIALRSRQLWGEIGLENPHTGFRAHGSLTVARNEAELEVIRRANNLPDSEKREFQMLSQSELRKLEPTLSQSLLGALHCRRDAIVEPQRVLPALRKTMELNPAYSWLPNTKIKDLSIDGDVCTLTAEDGREFQSEHVVLAPGAEHDDVFKDLFAGEAIRRVRLQMAAIDGCGLQLSHSIADGDSLRYYPAFRDCGLELLPQQDSIAAKYHMQLLLTQRLDGSITIGDTHEYQEPFDHKIEEEPYEHLTEVIKSIFNVEPSILRKWDGVYSQTIGKQIYFRKKLASRVHLISGLGGRGNTIAPAVAEETFQQWRIAS